MKWGAFFLLYVNTGFCFIRLSVYSDALLCDILRYCSFAVLLLAIYWPG